jgi:hypothetical protein
MATATPTPYQDRRLTERRRFAYSSFLTADAMRVSWGGVFGGVLVAMGLLFLLTALGVAVGISATDPGSTDLSSLGTGAGIWAAVSLLLALFVGGFVATRIGAVFDRTTGFFGGVLVWVVSLLLMGYLAASGVGSIAGGAFKLVGGATQAIGAVTQSAGMDLSSGSIDQVVQRLKDPQTAQQIAAATGLSMSEVQSALSEAAQRVENARNNPGQAAAEAKRGIAQLYEKAKSSGALQQKAEEMKPQATRAAWITFGALLLSLLTAVLGAMAGRREPQSQLNR